MLKFSFRFWFLWVSSLDFLVPAAYVFHWRFQQWGFLSCGNVFYSKLNIGIASAFLHSDLCSSYSVATSNLHSRARLSRILQVSFISLLLYEIIIGHIWPYVVIFRVSTVFISVLLLIMVGFTKASGFRSYTIILIIIFYLFLHVCIFKF